MTSQARINVSPDVLYQLRDELKHPFHSMSVDDGFYDNRLMDIDNDRYWQMIQLMQQKECDLLTEVSDRIGLETPMVTLSHDRLDRDDKESFTLTAGDLLSLEEVGDGLFSFYRNGQPHQIMVIPF